MGLHLPNDHEAYGLAAGACHFLFLLLLTDLNLPGNRRFSSPRHQQGSQEVFAHAEGVGGTETRGVNISGLYFFLKSWGGMLMALNAQCPHLLQQRLSSEGTPVLATTIPALELLMSQWEHLASTLPDYEPWIEQGLECARKYYRHMDDTSAHIIGLCKRYISLRV